MLPPPTNMKGLRRFLGAATYNSRFIWMYAEITRTLYSLLKEENKYEWAEECQRTFDEVKRILTTTPILVCPIWSMEFHIHCVVSNVAIGAVLAQNIHRKVDSPIYYANKLMNSAEKNYSTTVREALAMVYSVQIFCHCLQANHFIFYVDHQNLVVLDKPTNGVRMNC